MAIRSRATRAALAAMLLSGVVIGAVEAAPGGIVAAATGSGVYQLLGTIPTEFEFAAIQKADGTAAGTLHERLLFQGQLVEFTGAVTCITQDPVNHRAWIGGVVTSNTSVHPQFLQPRNAVGQDIWFRVVDYGEGADVPADRTTFLGFVPDAGFLSSAAYCAGQPWPANDERTWAVSEGNIQVHD